MWRLSVRALSLVAGVSDSNQDRSKKQWEATSEKSKLRNVRRRACVPTRAYDGTCVSGFLRSRLPPQHNRDR